MEIEEIIDLSQELYIKKNFLYYKSYIGETFDNINLGYCAFNLLLIIRFYKDCISINYKTKTFDDKIMVLNYKITYDEIEYSVIKPVDYIMLKLDLLQEKLYQKREEYEKFNKKNI